MRMPAASSAAATAQVRRLATTWSAPTGHLGRPKNRRAARLSLSPRRAAQFTVVERDDEGFDRLARRRWSKFSTLLAA